MPLARGCAGGAGAHVGEGGEACVSCGVGQWWCGGRGAASHAAGPGAARSAGGARDACMTWPASAGRT